jgi:hypothetical protein
MKIIIVTNNTRQARDFLISNDIKFKKHNSNLAFDEYDNEFRVVHISDSIRGLKYNQAIILEYGYFKLRYNPKLMELLNQGFIGEVPDEFKTITISSSNSYWYKY